ncbi:MAG: DJ-1/PfpI family protein [Thermoplasmatota archaeon]
MKVVFAAADGIDAHSLFATQAPFVASRAPIELAIAASDALVTAAGGARIVPNELRWRLDACDALVIPHGARALARDAGLLGALRRPPVSLRVVASIGDGATVLAAAGLVEGRRVASDKERVVIDGRVATAHAPADALELGFAVLERVTDAATARRARETLAR